MGFFMSGNQKVAIVMIMGFTMFMNMVVVGSLTDKYLTILSEQQACENKGERK